MKNGNCVHADVGMVCCVHGSRKLASLLIFYLMFVLFFVVVFVFVLLAYCSVVWAFVPHLEFLFLLVQGSAIVCFFFFFFLFVVVVFSIAVRLTVQVGYNHEVHHARTINQRIMYKM